MYLHYPTPTTCIYLFYLTPTQLFSCFTPLLLYYVLTLPHSYSAIYLFYSLLFLLFIYCNQPVSVCYTDMTVSAHTSVWLVVTLVLLTSQESVGVQVSTSLGLIYGFQSTENGTSINVFLGVPYAQPPIGDLRFRRPRPLTTLPSNGFNASHLPNSCYQVLASKFHTHYPFI